VGKAKISSGRGCHTGRGQEAGPGHPQGHLPWDAAADIFLAVPLPISTNHSVTSVSSSLKWGHSVVLRKLKKISAVSY
jgi:hypothetical protein